jgi:DNA-binding transcriptional MerR regulator
MEQSDHQSFSLDDLASKTGYDKRVIRSFIEQGLLRGPETMGRYARYSQAHLDRLLAIKALKDSNGLPISEVRQALLKISSHEIKILAKSATPEPVEKPSSALDYIKSLSRINKPGLGDLLPPSAHEPHPEIAEQIYAHRRAQLKSTPIEHLLIELGKLLEQRKVRRQAKGDSWYRICVTPDIEISMRGAESTEEQMQLERIADYLREILLGG